MDFNAIKQPLNRHLLVTLMSMDPLLGPFKQVLRNVWMPLADPMTTSMSQPLLAPLRILVIFQF